MTDSILYPLLMLGVCLSLAWILGICESLWKHWIKGWEHFTSVRSEAEGNQSSSDTSIECDPKPKQDPKFDE